MKKKHPLISTVRSCINEKSEEIRKLRNLLRDRNISLENKAEIQSRKDKLSNYFRSLHIAWSEFRGNSREAIEVHGFKKPNDLLIVKIKNDFENIFKHYAEEKEKQKKMTEVLSLALKQMLLE